MNLLDTVTYVKPFYIVRICILSKMLIQDQKVTNLGGSLNPFFISLHHEGALVPNSQINEFK